MGSAVDLMKGKWKEHQGPKTYPKIKKWCRGSCFRVICPMLSEIDALKTFIRKTKPSKIRKFARYVLKRLRVVMKDQNDALHKMGNDLS